MYNIPLELYFVNIFKFLKHKNMNIISYKKVLIYALTIIAIVIIGQILANYSEPYKSDNIENEKFIKAEIKKQKIYKIISLPIKQSLFNDYKEIVLENGIIYRPNFMENENEKKILKNSIIEKNAYSRIVKITSSNVTYEFKIIDLNNKGTKIFLFLISIFCSFIMIPIGFKQNELYKEYKKTATNSRFMKLRCLRFIRIANFSN